MMSFQTPNQQLLQQISNGGFVQSSGNNIGVFFEDMD